MTCRGLLTERVRRRRQRQRGAHCSKTSHQQQSAKTTKTEDSFLPTPVSAAATTGKPNHESGMNMVSENNKSGMNMVSDNSTSPA